MGEEKKTKLSSLQDPLEQIDGLDSQLAFYNKIQQVSIDQYNLLCIAIEDFRRINELYGREIGRKMLRLTAKKLAACCQKDEFLGRFKSDQCFQSTCLCRNPKREPHCLLQCGSKKSDPFQKTGSS